MQADRKLCQQNIPVSRRKVLLFIHSRYTSIDSFQIFLLRLQVICIIHVRTLRNASEGLS